MPTPQCSIGRSIVVCCVRQPATVGFYPSAAVVHFAVGHDAALVAAVVVGNGSAVEGLLLEQATFRSCQPLHYSYHWRPSC